MLISIWLILLTLVQASTSGASEPFSVDLVPTHSSATAATITMAHDTRNDFYIVLTNVSDRPQSVWEYWNSWGYRSISLQFITQEGQKILVTKKLEDFTRNFPSTFLLRPGEHQVFAIRLDHWWQAHPALPDNDQPPITVKVIYEVHPTPEATKYNVWTGRVESKDYNVVLRHW